VDVGLFEIKELNSGENGETNQ